MANSWKEKLDDTWRTVLFIIIVRTVLFIIIVILSIPLFLIRQLYLCIVDFKHRKNK